MTAWLRLCLAWLFLVVSASAEAPPDVRFAMARLHYSGGGDWYGNESSFSNLLTGLAQRTTIRCTRKEAVVTLKSNNIFYYPLVTVSGHGRVTFSDDEAERLRRYLIGGGFLWVDDDFGLDEHFRPALKRVFPEGQLVELPFGHPIYHALYEFPQGLPKIHEHHGGAPRGFGLYHQGRMVLFYSHNTDLCDGLEDADVHQDPPAKREAAMKMAINIVVYALTH